MPSSRKVGSAGTLSLLLWIVLVAPAGAQIRVNPTGVNVNMNNATTVFLTFGGLGDYRPVEAVWCGELVRATPDLGFRCDPSAIFGRLPLRFDQSRLSGIGGFTDLMSIPPSVARRAYQAAQAGQTSSFFYVRRFVNPQGGPDQYVAVTCRLAGGGARVPFALLDVELDFAVEAPILFIKPGETPPPLAARIMYNGTGRLKGRWEVVLPGEEPPTERDLLTEASLPIEERGTQRRYTQLERFNVFLPPLGEYILLGPDVSRLPTSVEGMYLVLLRVEVTDDKEGDSNLEAAGAGSGIVHSGAVAGFPLPPLRYMVGAGSSDLAATLAPEQLQPLAPLAEAVIPMDSAIDFAWAEMGRHAVYYRLEVEDNTGQRVLAAVIPRGAALYRAPPWLRDKAPDGQLRWRVVALNLAGREVGETVWRRLRISQPATALPPGT